MKSSNPILRNFASQQVYSLEEKTTTISGVINKLLFFSVISILGAAISIYHFNLGHYDLLNMIMTYSFFPFLILGIIIGLKPQTTPYLGTLFSFIQGAWVGAFSCFMEQEYNGIVSQAVMLTLLVVFVMAILFKTGLIKVTEKFRSVLAVATLAIGLFYLISFIAMFFFKASVAYFDMGNAAYSNPLVIGLNVVIVIVASLDLIVCFDSIENSVQNRLPAIYEWYGAFGLMVEVLWLYVEILRLLSRFRSR